MPKPMIRNQDGSYSFNIQNERMAQITSDPDWIARFAKGEKISIAEAKVRIAEKLAHLLK